MASFLFLPPELREMIYDLAFTTSTPPQNSTTLFHRVPGSLALRLTSTFMANESHRSYLKASRHYDTIRCGLIDAVISHYEIAAAPIHAMGIHESQAGAVNLHNLALGLCHPNPRCKHACAERGCYMCPDPAHQSCFDCGRNLAVALYCRIPAHATEAPQLIVPWSEGQSTKHGAWLERLPQRLGIARREEMSYAIYVPDPESCTGFKQKIEEGKLQVSWAFQWWRVEKHRQEFVDLRCAIRRKAVQGHYRHRQSGRLQLTEAWIMNLEKCDPRLKHVEMIAKHFAVGGVMEWKGEYKRMVEHECAMRGCGWDAEKLIPAYDQEKDAKTCRDAEWFP